MCSCRIKCTIKHKLTTRRKRQAHKLANTLLDTTVFMMLLMFTAFLSCAIMASVMPEELLDLVKSIPAQDELLIYDIRGDLSSDDVLAAFSGFNVPYKFKTLSGRRFLTVVIKESSNHTKYASLSFPGASQVDVYPAEHISDFNKYYGGGGVHDNSVIALPDDNLHLVEVTILEQGSNLTTFKTHVKAMEDEYRDIANRVKSRIFHVTAMMPVKMWGVISFPSYVIDRVRVEGNIVFSGPYQTKFVTTPIVNIY